MKTFLHFLLISASFLLLSFILMPCKATPERLIVADGGQSDYVILIPDDAEQELLARAADLLRELVFESCGVTLPVMQESQRPASQPAFCLGKSRAAAAAGIELDSIRNWDYVLRTVGKDIIIAGDDGTWQLHGVKRPPQHLGTLKGVTGLAESQWGIKFLIPGKFGRFIPRQQTLTVAADMNEKGRQIFDYVIGRRPRVDPTLAIALNLFGSTPILKTYSGHSYYFTVPKERYAASNPEYFALRGTTRDPSQNHLCISNPEVQEIMLQEMEKEFDNGYAWVELAQTDGYQACQCNDCQAIHPDEGERLWIVHRKLAEEMLTRRPAGRLMLISYGPTARPPTSFDSFPANVLVQLCYYSPEDMAQWESFDLDKTVYIYNWGSYKKAGLGPMRSPRYAIEQLRRFTANRVRGIYICGGFEADVGYGLNGPALYAFGKALENTDLDPDDVLNEYVNSLFEESAAPMRAFYRAYIHRLDTPSFFDNPNYPTATIPDSFRSIEDFYTHVFSSHVLQYMTLNLQRARDMASSEKVKALIQMVAMEYEYVRSIATVFHNYRSYRVTPKAATFSILEEAVADHNSLLNGMYDEKGRFLHKLPGGLQPLFAEVSLSKAQLNGRIMGMQPPFNWDFENMRKHNILPGVAKPKRIIASPIQEIRLDGKLDEEFWQKRQPERLAEISLGTTHNQTQFRVACDDRAFYFGIECFFDDPELITRLESTGRDGNAWQQECIEIALDPFGEREKHCQMVFSPISDSLFDARRGYIDDVLHPLYGKPDLSWDGDWEVAWHVNLEKGVWTAEVRIPYETLDVESPADGDAWTLNLGRAEWPIPYGRDGYSRAARYSTWSPNFESRSFHDRATFGEIVFDLSEKME